MDLSRDFNDNTPSLLPPVYCSLIHTPVGYLHIRSSSLGIHTIKFLAEEHTPTAPNPEDTVTCTLRRALDLYFKKEAGSFDHIRIYPQGTPFQQSVWQLMQTIPLGQTKTYKELAQILKTSPRAIGQACRNNPLPILTPCHRVVSSQAVGGFMGQQTGPLWQIKLDLLQHERAFLNTRKQSTQTAY